MDGARLRTLFGTPAQFPRRRHPIQQFQPSIFPGTDPAAPLHLSPEQVALLSLFAHQRPNCPADQPPLGFF